MKLSGVGDYDWSSGEFFDYGASAPPVIDFGGTTTPVFYEYSYPVQTPWGGAAPTVNAPAIGGPGILDNLLKVGQSLIPMWLQTDAQRQLNEINVERAKRGQPPINAQQYMQQMAVPQMQFGLNAQTQSMAYTALLAVGGFFLVREVVRPGRGGGRRRRR